MLSHQVTTYTVVQIGNLDRARIANILGLANETQRAFRFEFAPESFPLDEKHKVPGAYDMESAIQSIIRSTPLPRPLIFLSAQPYGQHEAGDLTSNIFFSDTGLEFDPRISIVSTYLWEEMTSGHDLQSYILYSLAQIVLAQIANLEYHMETRGCLFDYCEETEDIFVSMKGNGLCSYHDSIVHQTSGTTPDLIASAMRLYNRAANKKLCFVAMPFTAVLEPMYKRMSRLLRKKGWTVQRADEIVYPRLITDAILEAILKSDLVIADLTDENANVFYEVGLAQGLGCDVMLLTQNPELPFDVAASRTIFYELTEDGLRKLGRELDRFIESNIVRG